jgi:hypothetical protein
MVVSPEVSVALIAGDVVAPTDAADTGGADNRFITRWRAKSRDA